MQSTLSIDIIYQDEHLIKLEISASAGGYTGITRVYTSRQSLAELAERIKGFPRYVTEVVQHTFGEKENFAFARLMFRCVDGLGHTRVQVALYEAEVNTSVNRSPQEVHLDMLFEPASLNRFIDDLLLIVTGQKDHAELRVPVPHADPLRTIPG